MPKDPDWAKELQRNAGRPDEEAKKNQTGLNKADARRRDDNRRGDQYDRDKE